MPELRRGATRLANSPIRFASEEKACRTDGLSLPVTVVDRRVTALCNPIGHFRRHATTSKAIVAMIIWWD